jgi:U6 snRNA-associated Sm-like protein LSm7
LSARFDPLLNIVLDDCIEHLRDPDDPYRFYIVRCAVEQTPSPRLTDDTRTLGLVVCRGTAVVLICPVDGMEAIANPFVAQE